MRTLGLLLALLAFPLSAHSQDIVAPDGATISSAHLSGFDLAQLSPGLQEDIGRLAGTSLDRSRLDALAARIEAEQPRVVAAVRVSEEPKDAVRVVFVVAPRRRQDREANINARYIIEEVELRGASEGDLAADLRAALQALTGQRLDAENVERFESDLRTALPDYDVRRRVVRGTQSGQVRVLFILNRNESSRWLHFKARHSSIVYHSKQGWGAALDLPISGRNVSITPIMAFDNGDDLVEEYSGFGVRVEARKLGTERLGASFEWSTFDPTWRPATTAVVVDARHLLYEQRSTVAPTIRFAVARGLELSGGVTVSELKHPEEGTDGEMANAVAISLAYDSGARFAANERHAVEAAVGLRIAAEGLRSDYDYTRLFVSGAYQFRRGPHRVLLSGLGGTISDTAPLFERFTLGDSQTLRGWNKYDIAPAGGDRVLHTSIEYRYRGLAFFVDAGSVWERDLEREFRVASGIGYHPGPFFMTLGFPLNADDVRAVFTMGVRFGGIGITKY